MNGDSNNRTGRSRSRPQQNPITRSRSRPQHNVNPANLQWNGNFFSQDQGLNNEPLNQQICDKYKPNKPSSRAAVRFRSPPPPRIPRRKSKRDNYANGDHTTSPTNSRHQKRSKTFTHRNDIDLQLPDLPVASGRIRANSLTPKEVPDIMPKDKLTHFLVHYDLKELKPQLQQNQIELEHLLFVDPNDLNELCIDLKLTASQKIRFKFAVKELQHQSHEEKEPHSSTHTSPSLIPMNKPKNDISPILHDMSRGGSARMPKESHSQPLPMMARSKSAKYQGNQANFTTRPRQHFRGYTEQPSNKYMLKQSRTTATPDDEEKLPSNPPQIGYNNTGSTFNTINTLNIPNADEPRSLSLPGLPGYVPTHPQQQLLTMSSSQGRFVPPPPPRTRDRLQTISMNASAVSPQMPHIQSNTPNMAASHSKPPQILVSTPTQTGARHRKRRRNSAGTPVVSVGSRGSSSWSEWHEQWKSVVRESAKGRNEITMQSSIRCTSVTQCCCIKRMIYLMRFYAQFKTKGLEMMEMMKAIHLKEYTVIDMLNDHYHILQYHKQTDADFHYIYQEIKGGSERGVCKINECPMIKRNHLCNYGEYILFYCGLSNPDDVICIQLLDKIHCSYLHCYDLYRFSVEQNKQLQAAAMKMEKDPQIQKNHNERLLHTKYYKKVSKFMDAKNFNLKEAKGVYKCSESNKYSTQWNHVQNEFGAKFIYDQYIQKQQQYENTGQYVVAQHKNLKQEMLNNATATLSNKDWNVSLRKCQNYYFHTNKIKQFEQKMDIEIMLCLYIFVNFEQLPQKFISTFFVDDERKKKSNHSSFYHFARILQSGITAYGLTFENSYNFFHGLIGSRRSNEDTDHGSFIDDIYLKFQCPILTTSRFEVIYNYQSFALKHRHKHGVILNITSANASNASCRFIDTSWFANVECEESQILFAESPIKPVHFRIASIIDLRCFANYYYYMNAIYILQCILWQQAVNEQQLRITEEIYKAAQILIECMTEPQIRAHYGPQMMNILKLFSTICKAQHRIKINIQQIVDMFSITKCKNSFLLNYFVRCSGRGIYILNIENLMALYPNMSSLSVSSQYLHESVFVDILKLYSNTCTKADTKMIQHLDLNNIRYAKGIKNVYASIGGAVAEYQDKFESIGYRLEMDQRIDNVLVLSKQNYAFNISNTTEITVTIRDPIRNSMAIDYSNMNINTYQEDIYEIQLKLDNQQLISVNITHDDLSDLHSWMTKKRKGITSLKMKTKLPSNTGKQQLGDQQRKRQEKKVEAYLKHLFQIVLKHSNQMFKRHLYGFLVQNQVV